MLGKIVNETEIGFENINQRNLVAEVSTKTIKTYNERKVFKNRS